MNTTYHVEILSKRVGGDSYFVGPFHFRDDAEEWADDMPRMRDRRVGQVLTWSQVRREAAGWWQILPVCEPTEEALELVIAEALYDAPFHPPRQPRTHG